jgi:hypothetical protein
MRHKSKRLRTLIQLEGQKEMQMFPGIAQSRRADVPTIPVTLNGRPPERFPQHAQIVARAFQTKPSRKRRVKTKGTAAATPVP